MPVKHDLFADLKLSADEFKHHEKRDPHLTHLLDKYKEVDREVLEAASAQMADEELRKLKERRLQVKDKIVGRLQGHH